MSFKCTIGIHVWDGCKCSECGKIRDTGHEVSADCGMCSKCGSTFSDEAHDWSKDCDKCARCGKKRENQHSWTHNCEKCSKCGVIRSNMHHLQNGICQVCGQGSYIDPDDGSTHKILKIGDQVIMASNLAKIPSKGKYWVYDDNEDNKVEYGLLYDLEAARSLAPSGWHLPSKAEWEAVHAFLGGDDKKVYKEMKSGGATGFNNVLGGERLSRGAFNSLRASGNYWSDTAENEKEVWQFKIGAFSETAGFEKVDPDFGLSVRLFRDR
jgi:uncharacterized protein (TIGR02145 family)